MLYIQEIMKLLTFKAGESLLHEMDRIVKEYHFSNRTEFIRAAIREKIEKCETVKFISKQKPREYVKESHKVRDYTG